ncbi:hypothetical protein [Sphingomonas sp. KR3-1]|uniref:hypothetical protein n=1 Tax=Sphingomonas sp. KR3-1 TaxID=3156611 RepID=UPI0032B61BE3
MIRESAGPAPAPEPALRHGRSSLPAKLALAFCAWAASILIVFRDSFASGFDLGFGNRGDALIEISILEHWRAVFTGLAAWNQPIYFHPYGDTLGYNDGYFLSGLIYAFWRICFDPFVSDTLTAMTFRTIGFAAALWLVRGVLRWSWGTAILVAALFTISNNMFLQAGHAQINSLALLPLLAGLAVLAVRAEISGRPVALLFAALVALVMGLWLITAFYFAWFTIYFTVVFVLCWLWVSGNYRPRRLGALLAAHWRTLATFLAVAAVSAIPFLLVYLPKRLETGGHGYMVSYLVQPVDLVNVGERNGLWGWIATGIRLIVQAVATPGGKFEKSFLGWEHHSGYPLLLFALTCAAAYRLIRDPKRVVERAVALAVVVSWALTLRIWQISPWILVHALFPAASGVRVVLRYQLFLVLPVLLLVGLAYRDRLRDFRQRHPWLAVLLVVLLVGEQISFAQPAELSRRAQRAELDAIPAPPAGCSAFYVVTVRSGEAAFVDDRVDALYPHNVDAMFLAEKWRVPTVNGYSTFNPPDWDFAAPYASDYDARVRSYAGKHGVRELCRLDTRSPQAWTRMD